VFHAEVRGSPVLLLKRGQSAGPDSLREAAQFTASYSRSWREGLSSTSVYNVRPSQVSVAAPSGQYMPRGSFMVYGERRYLTVELALAASLELRGTQPHVEVRPRDTSAKLGTPFVELRPGPLKAEVASPRAVDYLLRDSTAAVSKEVKAKLVSQLVSAIPFGRCAIYAAGKQLL